MEGGTGGSTAPVASSTDHEGCTQRALGAGRSPSPQQPDEDKPERGCQVCRQAYKPFSFVCRQAYHFFSWVCRQAYSHFFPTGVRVSVYCFSLKKWNTVAEEKKGSIFFKKNEKSPIDARASYSGLALRRRDREMRVYAQTTKGADAGWRKASQGAKQPQAQARCKTRQPTKKRGGAKPRNTYEPKPPAPSVGATAGSSPAREGAGDPRAPAVGRGTHGG